ncbi:hypothetical protein A2U01_0110797, partial [Trifolium medium]|nr:hypothetical protein [Trifolium medium]
YGQSRVQVDSFAGTHLVVDDSFEVPPMAVEAGVHDATVVGSMGFEQYWFLPLLSWRDCLQVPLRYFD